jgi:preprotein translocase subunit SecD
MKNNDLNQLKHFYRAETLSEENVAALWRDLSEQLPARQYHSHHFTMRYAALALVMIFFFTGSAYAVQSAAPNTPLYSLRVQSENITAQLSGQYDELIEYRTDVIINAAQKKSDAEIQKAADDYKKTLEAARVNEQTKNTETKARLKESLNEAESKLRTVTPTSNKGKNVLRESLNETKKAKQEVKAAQTEEKKSENRGSDNKQDSPSSDNKGQGNNNNQGNGNGNNKK